MNVAKVLGRSRLSASFFGSRTFASSSGKVKRAKTAYVLYVKDNLTPTRERLLSEGVDKSVANRHAMTIMGQNWRNASAMDKAKYERMAADDKARADRERAAIKAARGPIKLSAYQKFVKSKFSQMRVGDEGAPQVMKKISAAWKSMSDAEKAAFK